MLFRVALLVTTFILLISSFAAADQHPAQAGAGDGHAYTHGEPPVTHNLHYQKWRLETLLTRARHQLDAGKTQDALTSLTRARDIGLWDARIQSLLGDAYLRQGQWTDAVVALRRATGSEADRLRLAQALTEVAWERFTNRNPGDAVRLWEEAVLKYPSYGPAHGGLGVAFLRSGDIRRAVGHSRTAAELEPNEGMHWSNCGLALLVDGRLEEAAAATLRSLDLEPDDPVSLSNLAFVRFEQGRVDHAVELWERALEKRGGLADAWAGLGVGLWTRGDQDEAQWAYRRAVVRNRDYQAPDLLAGRYFWPPRAVDAARDVIRALSEE